MIYQFRRIFQSIYSSRSYYQLIFTEQMEQDKINNKVKEQDASESSIQIVECQKKIQNNKYLSSSIIKVKTKSIKKTSKYYQQQKKKKLKKGKKVVHTFIICIVNREKSDFVIETDILDLTSRKKNINDKQVEAKVKQMASRHRDMIMNQKYYDLRKNKEDNKSSASYYPGMNYGDIYNRQYAQYPGYNMNYIMPQIGWQNYHSNMNGQRPY